MKPLPPAPLTNEDWLILVDHGGVAKNAYVMGWRLAHSRESDRRDAALMFDMQRYRWALIFGLPCSVHWVEGLEIRGRFRGRVPFPGQDAT